MKEQKQKRLGGSLLLTATALIWGVSFVAQSVSAELVGPFTFNAVRTLLGGLVLILWLLAGKGKKTQRERSKGESRQLIAGGVCCGLALCAASNLQQIGIAYTKMCIRDRVNIVQEEAGAYFNGQKSLDETLKVITNRLRLYLEENS